MKAAMALICMAALIGMAPEAAAEALEGRASGAEILAGAENEDFRTLDPARVVRIELARGAVFVALSPQLARRHVVQFETLAREGFYDGLSFYRVIDGFVAQGGDVAETRDTALEELPAAFDEPASELENLWLQPDADGYAPRVGWLDSLPVGVSLTVEGVPDRVWHLHCAGALAMARDEGRDTARTEFYITLQPQRYLDRNLTVFGRVIEGMEHLQALRRVTPQPAEAEGDEDGDHGEDDRLHPLAGRFAERGAAHLPGSRQRAADFRDLRRGAPQSA